MRVLLLTLFALSCYSIQAQNRLDIKEFAINGPYYIDKPFIADSTNAKGKKFADKDLLNSVPSKSDYKLYKSSELPYHKEQYSVGSLLFYLNHENFYKGKININGIKNYKVYIDDIENNSNNLKLTPPHHKIEIKFVVAPSKKENIEIYLEGNGELTASTTERHRFNLNDMLYGKRVSGGQLSADGRYIIATYSTTDKKSNVRRKSQVEEIATGRIVYENNTARWLPNSSEFLITERENNSTTLYRVNPNDGSRRLWIENIPQGSITVSPTEDYIVITNSDEGVKEDKDVYQIITPDDRQPGWRNRSYISIYNISNKINKRLIYGNKSSHLQDISHDGRKLIIGISREQIEKRPHTTTDYLLYDVKTQKFDTLITGEDFISTLKFSPDSKKILIKGSPEAFNRIGSNLSADKIPSMYDMQLYMFDIQSKKVTPLTKNFKPSIENFVWNKSDNLIYTTVTEGEYKFLYTINPKDGKVSKLDLGVENVANFYLSASSPILSYIGGGATKPNALYTMNLSNKQYSLYNDCADEIYRNVQMGECKEWNFVNRLGDTIQGRFYLPPQFDSSKKYPLIVNYYGGCTPTARALETRYPQEYYASLGYVVYVVQPSGAIGFGEEFSARHVGTWGKFTADDILEGVDKFCDAHKYVNREKIGCIGASYGGFMTMYLQTVSNIFACAISHAGISNIASYWGEGYWGYSYGHVASGNNYPWNAREMYVEQSPLFNADKIETPLLLLHGSADTNVPHIESIQMFNALKILGKEVAFVEVNGENHWILEYSKRIKWSNTIMAWFQKYLKEDSTWWDELYPDKML